MSIEAQLSEVATLLKQLIALQQGQPAPLATPMPGPSGTGPGQTVPTAAPVPVAAPPAAVPPGAPVPGPQVAPVATPPMAPGAPAPTPGPTPVAPAPAASGITLDQIRDKLNNFWREHPDRSGEIMVILGEVGVSDVASIPATHYQFVWDKLTALGA